MEKWVIQKKKKSAHQIILAFYLTVLKFNYFNGLLTIDSFEIQSRINVQLVLNWGCAASLGYKSMR